MVFASFAPHFFYPKTEKKQLAFHNQFHPMPKHREHLLSAQGRKLTTVLFLTADPGKTLTT